MPAPAIAPRIAPGTTIPGPGQLPMTEPGMQPELWPIEICPQQKREHASPDVSP